MNLSHEESAPEMQNFTLEYSVVETQHDKTASQSEKKVSPKSYDISERQEVQNISEPSINVDDSK